MNDDINRTRQNVQPENQPLQAYGGRKRLESGALFGGSREIIIEHAGNEYRLRLTHQNKLILTK